MSEDLNWSTSHLVLPHFPLSSLLCCVVYCTPPHLPLPSLLNLHFEPLSHRTTAVVLGRYNEMSPPLPCAGGGCLLCHYPPTAKTAADIFVSEPELELGKPGTVHTQSPVILCSHEHS